MSKDHLNSNLFNLNPLPSWIYNYQTFQILDVNIAAIEHYGYSKEEFLMLTIKDIRPPHEMDKLIKAHATIKDQNGNISFGVFTHLKKDGTPIQVEINGHKIDFSNQECILVVCQDITKRMEQEELILQSEQRFKALVQEGSDMISIIDTNGKYSYTSPTTTAILGITPEEFQGNTVFDFIHPEDIEKASKYMQRIANERKVIVEPFRLKDGNKEWRWIETVLTNMTDNPAIRGIVANSRDITKQKEEEQQLRLLSSAVTNTKDSVVITEVELIDNFGPKIIYVNEAFTKMTGYKASEIIGKSTKILHGPNSDHEELKKMNKAIEKWESCEITIVNYKKNGEEFWNNFKISPVADDKGIYTHWIAVQRDVTEQKQKELEKELLGKISLNFSSEKDLLQSSKLLCQTICEYGQFDLVELWMPNIENTKLQLIANNAASKDGSTFSELTKEIRNFKPNEGLLGTVWSKKKTTLWEDINKNNDFVRKVAAEKTAIKNAATFPLIYNNQVMGILLIATQKESSHLNKHIKLFEQLKEFIGSEINRKKLENDLGFLYNTIPDILFLSDFKGRLLKINKAGCDLLGYSEEELLYQPFYNFVHPEDKLITKNEFEDISQGGIASSFQNRFQTKNGKVIWLSWTSKASLKEGLIYAIAKNITEEKKIKELNRQTRELAKVGGWEYDLMENNLFWSDEVHRLHETDPKTFIPDVNTAISFYKEEHKDYVTECITKSITEGVSLDYEAIIITKSNKERWIRVIGNPEYIEGKCVKFIGSFQDITDRKETEDRLENISDNIPGVVYQYIVHPDGQQEVKNVSKGVEKIWGYSANQIMSNINLAWDQIKAGGDYTEVKQSIKDSMISRKNWSCRFRLLDPNGNKKVIQGFGKPEFLVDGTIFYNSILLDVTQETHNEELLAQVTKLAKIGSWELDSIENKVYWSNTVHELHETDPTTFIPNLKKGINFYREDFRQMVAEKTAKSLETGIPFDFEAVIVTAKNKERWVRSIGNAEMVNGKCIRLYGSFQDIHEQKENELRLKSISKDLLKAYEEKNKILESIGDAFFTVDKNWIVTYWNKEAEIILGMKREAILGENLWEIYADAHETNSFQQYHKALKTLENINFEDYYATLNKWFEVTVYPSQEGLSVYLKDITLRKEVDIRLIQANERFEKVTEATNDAIWDFDVVNNSLFWGKGFQTLFGYNLEVIQPSFDLLASRIHEDDRERIISKIGLYMQDKNLKNWHEEYRFIKADGSVAFVIDRATFLRNPQGKVVRVIGAMTDITKQKNNEAQLIALNESLQSYAKELERSNEELEQFAFITSHDLQEPLRMVSSFMDQLKRKYEDKLDDKALQYIEFATNGSKRMKQIILDLLEYSRAGRPTDLIEKVDINEIITDFKLLRGKIIDEKSATITHDNIPVIKTYKTGITQVFHSLLDNAIKYSKKEEAPNIKITCKEENDKWIFAVKDNGIGIDPRFFSKIFIIFQRLHNREEYEGTGIGLSIVKRHIDFLGGKIWVESELEKGATFYFEIPKTNDNVIEPFTQQ